MQGLFRISCVRHKRNSSPRLPVFSYASSHTPGKRHRKLDGKRSFSWQLTHSPLISKQLRCQRSLGWCLKKIRRSCWAKEEVKEDKKTSKKCRKCSSFFGKVKRASFLKKIFIVVFFAIHWHESAMDLHVFPFPIPAPASLPIPSLWVFPVHQPWALVSCIQPGLVICFTLDSILVSMLFSLNSKKGFFLHVWFHRFFSVLVLMLDHWRFFKSANFVNSFYAIHNPHIQDIPCCNITVNVGWGAHQYIENSGSLLTNWVAK